MKQRIRINESQLRRIVSESVKGCLNEVFFVFLSIESILGSGRKVANAFCAIKYIVSFFLLPHPVFHFYHIWHVVFHDVLETVEYFAKFIPFRRLAMGNVIIAEFSQFLTIRIHFFIIAEGYEIVVFRAFLVHLVPKETGFAQSKPDQPSVS